MSDYDGDGDVDGDDGFDSDMTGSDGNPIVYVDGEAMTVMDSGAGQVLLDGDRNVVATLERDGDIRFEDGHTLTPVSDGSGYSEYSNTEGGTVTVRDNTAGFTEYQSDGGDGQEFQGGDSDSGSADAVDGSYAEVEDGEVGSAGGGSSDSSMNRRSPRRQQTARPAQPTYTRSDYRRQEKRGFVEMIGIFFLQMLVFGASSFVVSTILMTIVANAAGHTVALTFNGFLWVVVSVIAATIWFAARWYRSFSKTLTALFISLGYGFGLVMYIIYLTTYLWK